MSWFGRRSKRNVLKMNACRIWSSFNQSCHWFVVLLLPRSFLASRIVSSGVVSQWKKKWMRAEWWRENLGPTAMYFWKIFLLLNFVLTILIILTAILVFETIAIYYSSSYFLIQRTVAYYVIDIIIIIFFVIIIIINDIHKISVITMAVAYYCHYYCAFFQISIKRKLSGSERYLLDRWQWSSGE